MNKEELLKIYSAYLPYGLFVKSFNIFTGNPVFILGLKDNGRNNIAGLEWVINEGFENFKPVLFDLSYLTKEELQKAGFGNHIDFLTNEREGWIKKYGVQGYINQLPYGHFMYLIQNHYNVFNLSTDQFINKATLNK